MFATFVRRLGLTWGLFGLFAISFWLILALFSFVLWIRSARPPLRPADSENDLTFQEFLLWIACVFVVQIASLLIAFSGDPQVAMAVIFLSPLFGVFVLGADSTLVDWVATVDDRIVR